MEHDDLTADELERAIGSISDPFRPPTGWYAGLGALMVECLFCQALTTFAATDRHRPNCVWYRVQKKRYARRVS